MSENLSKLAPVFDVDSVYLIAAQLAELLNLTLVLETSTTDNQGGTKLSKIVAINPPLNEVRHRRDGVSVSEKLMSEKIRQVSLKEEEIGKVNHFSLSREIHNCSVTHSLIAVGYDLVTDDFLSPFDNRILTYLIGLIGGDLTQATNSSHAITLDKFIIKSEEIFRLRKNEAGAYDFGNDDHVPYFYYRSQPAFSPLLRSVENPTFVTKIMLIDEINSGIEVTVEKRSDDTRVQAILYYLKSNQGNYLKPLIVNSLK